MNCHVHITGFVCLNVFSLFSDSFICRSKHYFAAAFYLWRLMKFYLIRSGLRIISVAPVINYIVALNLHHGMSGVGWGSRKIPIIQVFIQVRTYTCVITLVLH